MSSIANPPDAMIFSAVLATLGKELRKDGKTLLLNKETEPIINDLADAIGRAQRAAISIPEEEDTT
jgi:hypothetical protein